MASQAQKKPEKAEETEASQIKQLAVLMLDFHKAQYVYVQALEKLDCDKSFSSKSSEFVSAKKTYDAELRKVTGFALSHVQFLRRMLETSLTEEHTNLNGERLGLQQDDRKALQVIDGVKGTEYSISARITLNSGLWPTPTQVMLSTKTKSGVVPLFYFYHGGSEASEKTGNVALYPSDWVYGQADKSPLSSVPKKNQ